MESISGLKKKRVCMRTSHPPNRLARAQAPGAKVCFEHLYMYSCNTLFSVNEGATYKQETYSAADVAKCISVRTCQVGWL